MTDWIPDPETLVVTHHETERQLALLEAAGCQRPADCRLSLSVPESDRDMARWLLTTRGLDPARPWLVLHPGLSHHGNTDGFVEIAQTLMQEYDYQLVLTGSAAERSSIEQIARRLTGKAVNLAGELSMGTLGGLLAEAPVLLADTTGPVHLAAALQTPVVIVYATPGPQHACWQAPHRIFYSDVPDQLRSRNLLPHQLRGVSDPIASPAAIVEAVLSVARQPTSASGVWMATVTRSTSALPSAAA